MGHKCHMAAVSRRLIVPVGMVLGGSEANKELLEMTKQRRSRVTAVACALIGAATLNLAAIAVPIFGGPKKTVMARAKECPWNQADCNKGLIDSPRY